jgi:hypothetical protein
VSASELLGCDSRGAALHVHDLPVPESDDHGIGSVHNDGMGPVPGFDDGNPLTVEVPGWRPLLPTPNHPEYPSAHCTITSAVSQVIAHWMGTDAINIDLQGNANFSATRHFATVQDLISEVENARVWAGLHYRFSTIAGASLGKRSPTTTSPTPSTQTAELSPWGRRPPRDHDSGWGGQKKERSPGPVFRNDP